MRNREAIRDNVEESSYYRTITNNQKLIIEVLLDIRERIIKRFEYCFIKADPRFYDLGTNPINADNNYLKTELDSLGQDGWEITGCGTYGDHHVIYFKREIV